jgi:hypothetical protein
VRRATVAAVAACVALSLAPGALAGTWCGTGEVSPDRVDIANGAQTHVVYAVASDSVDHFVDRVGGIVDDVDSLQAWWETQDATRTPRFDLADFGGDCTTLDIGFVRFSLTGALVAQGPFALQRVVNGLADAGLTSRYKRYLVYYDGPPFNPDVCGTTSGGSFAAGPSYAVVWLNACPLIAHDFVAVHELVHAFGAVARGAPHTCVFSPAHVCDSTQDLMYPVAPATPLANAILDVGHDDYYAHSGTWVDVQDSSWLRRLDLPQQHLEVSFSGHGRVTSDVPGVACTSDCDTLWDGGTLVTLNASGLGGESRFVGWRGPCTGRATCAVTLDAARSVTAVFGPVTVVVHVAAAGHGRIVCSPRCGAGVPAGSVVRLRATPARGWRFAGWSGGCRGAAVTCTPATDFDVSVRATFRR